MGMRESRITNHLRYHDTRIGLNRAVCATSPMLSRYEERSEALTPEQMQKLEEEQKARWKEENRRDAAVSIISFAEELMITGKIDSRTAIDNAKEFYFTAKGFLETFQDNE